MSLSIEAAGQPLKFDQAYLRFQQLIAANDKGHPFTNFEEGIAAVMEGYKPRLRARALTLLDASAWTKSSVGTGEILQNVVRAIEIQEGPNMTNNLVFWQNRFGHASREHRALLDAITNPKLRRDLESSLYGLYRGDADEAEAFDHLSLLVGAKYPLLAYLFFLKDINRFMPIHPTGFDRAFQEMGIDLVTLRNCSWDNYTSFNGALDNLRPALTRVTGLHNLRLVDAHSFCWIFRTLLKLEENGEISGGSGQRDAGRIVGGREKSVVAMRLSVEDTVKGSNGQYVERRIKDKELRMTPSQLEAYIGLLLDSQENRCALTGIPFEFHGATADRNLFPSVDRKDSNGHYELGNLQIVCRFINFWKSDGNDAEFQRLLMLVRGFEDA